MPVKRAFEDTVTDDELLGSSSRRSSWSHHRKRVVSIPETPLPNRWSSPVKTPFTGTPYPSRPSDSPSNPFGQKRKKTLVHTLPAPTPFSKHLALRFQFVQPSVSPRLGGVYRIVQVPKNYTFVQLRCLIAFLFGAGYGDIKKDRHLFEVQKKVTTYSPMYKPGQIKTGWTCVKLSTARDPCRYRPEEEEEDALDDASEEPASESESQTNEGDEDEEWTWQQEEEYTLAHVWPRGIDLTRGIIYHHDEKTAVYITSNTDKIPARKGTSNIPYVFKARGRVCLLPSSPPPLPKPSFSTSIKKLVSPDTSRSAKRRKLSPSPPRGFVSTQESEDVGSEDSDTESESESSDSDSDRDREYGDASSSGFFSDGIGLNEDEGGDSDEEACDDSDLEEEKEDLNALPSVGKYNRPNAFATYLRLVHQRLGHWRFPQSESEESDDEPLPHPSSTPGLTFSSSPYASSEAAPSSPISDHLNPFDLYEASACTLSVLSKAAYTPAPMHAPWQKLRLDRMRKRMDKSKRKWFSAIEDSEGEDQEADQLDAAKTVASTSADVDGEWELYDEPDV